MISDFTVHIKHLDLKGEKIYDEVSELLKFIEDIMVREDKDLKNADQIIYDANFPIMTIYQLDHMNEINELELQKIQLHKDDKDEDLNKIEELKEKIKEKKKELKASFVADLDDTDDVFITFHSQHLVKTFKDLYTEIGGCKRKCYKCLGRNDYDHLM